MDITDILYSIGLEVMQDKLKSKNMDAEAKKRLEEYLSRQEKINELCTQDEEIDFQKLSDYICKDLINDMKLRFYGNTSERAAARNNIIQKAMCYANANCQISEKRAAKIIDDAMSILKGFFRRSINKDTLFAMGEIGDAVEEHTDRAISVMEERFKQLERKIDNTCSLSLDKSIELIDAGKVEVVGDNLSTHMDRISTRHCLYPYYGFGMVDGKNLGSIPRRDDALKRYPPKMTMNISDIRIGEHPVPPESDFLDKAYRFQQPVCFYVNNATKFLGDIQDPDQHEAKEAIGSYLVLTPQKFEETGPVRICADGETFFDYVPLKLRKILNDGTRVMTNEDHEARGFDITHTYLPPDKPFTVSIAPKAASTHDMLRFYQFMKKIDEGATLEVCDLETGIRRAAGNKTDAKTSCSDALIEAIKKLMDIEKYLKKQFCIKSMLSDQDLWLIKCIHTLIAGGELEGNWEKEDFPFTVDNSIRGALGGLEDSCYTPEFTTIVNLELLGETFGIPIKRKLDGARVYELDKMKNSLSELKDGDVINLTFIPADGEISGHYKDVLADKFEYKLSFIDGEI